MSSIWSEFVQKAGTLYTSRRVRFDDYFRERFTQVFEIPDGARILEIRLRSGCALFLIVALVPEFCRDGT